MSGTARAPAGPPRRSTWRSVAILLLGFSCLAPSPSAAQVVADRGDITLWFMEPTTVEEGQVAAYLTSSYSDLDGLVGDINEIISLAEDIQVRFYSDPATPLASYESGVNWILIPYGYVVQISRLFGGDPMYWYPNVEQVMLHEIAHALIDVNQIGLYPDENPEVAADALAFFMLSEFYDDEQQLELVAYRYDLRSAQNSPSVSGSVPSTPHVPDAARASDYRCWVEGKVTGRGECFERYRNLVDIFAARLEPFWKIR